MQGSTICGINNKTKEDNMVNDNLFVKTLVKCFGETKTIKMLNQVNKRSINKKARRYIASLNVHQKLSA